VFRNRIVGEGEESPEQLLANPRNWRIHPREQQEALSDILERVGWVQRVTINQRTGYVLDGHLRVSLAISRDESTIPVQYVDLSESEEAEMLAVLDPLTSMVAPDKSSLADLLQEVKADIGVSDLVETIGRKYDLDEDLGFENPEPLPKADCVCDHCGNRHRVTLEMEDP
jgi:hypothetical protein